MTGDVTGTTSRYRAGGFGEASHPRPWRRALQEPGPQECTAAGRIIGTNLAIGLTTAPPAASHLRQPQLQQQRRQTSASGQAIQGETDHSPRVGLGRTLETDLTKGEAVSVLKNPQQSQRGAEPPGEPAAMLRQRNRIAVEALAPHLRIAGPPVVQPEISGLSGTQA